MTIITLSDISQQLQHQSGNLVTSPINYSQPVSLLQQHFQLAVKQKQLGLPVESLLQEHQLIANWIEQLEGLIPGLFKSNKQVYLDLLLTVKFTVIKGQEISIETPVNLAFIKGKPRLLEWAIRQPDLNWRDQMKLWVVTRHLRLEPSNLGMTICSFNPDSLPVKVTYSWSKKQHREIHKRVKSVFTQFQPESNGKQVQMESIKMKGIKMIDAIEEIPI